MFRALSNLFRLPLAASYDVHKDVLFVYTYMVKTNQERMEARLPVMTGTTPPRWEDDERSPYAPLDDWIHGRAQDPPHPPSSTLAASPPSDGGWLGRDLLGRLTAASSSSLAERDRTRAVDYTFYLSPEVRKQLGWCFSYGEREGEDDVSLTECWKRARDAACGTLEPDRAPNHVPDQVTAARTAGSGDEG